MFIDYIDINKIVDYLSIILLGENYLFLKELEFENNKNNN